MKYNYLNEKEKDDIIDFLITLVNHIIFESGKIEGTRGNLDSIKNLLNRDFPPGLTRSKGLIKAEKK